MEIDVLYHRLQTEPIWLFFDTSVIFKTSRFFNLCGLVNQLNEHRPSLPIKLCVSTVAHAEMLFHLAQKRQDFNINIVNRELAYRNIQIISFSADDSALFATTLGQRYPTVEAWHEYKRKQCLNCLDLPKKCHDLAKGRGKRCGAPNDWLIVAHAKRDHTILVMDDNEFRLFNHVAQLEPTRQAVQQILDEF